jgi:hypothetical protein
MDFDDLLDDISVDESLEEDETDEYKAELEGLPEDLVERWCELITQDKKGIEESSTLSIMQPSYQFRAYDDTSNPAKPPAPHKLLQDCVRQACVRCNFNEAVSSRLMSITNALETNSGRVLQSAYNKQVLSDFRKQVVADPSYDPKQFPQLTEQYSS